ncbi:endonuclease/exonuclease/phosphatase family protein [Solimonas flava]|uniref:endonuclease/exonuclease/phosphatase family protein n=1 Tax=Solimonas flava TaxID=415849 RepID=UPI0004141C4D|nr:endonuclease/exonuclease/phosphatase family protein [Solimonas flava]
MPARDTPFELTLLTLNVHQGFSALQRRFVLHELRAAIRGVSADLVFLQEVLGRHSAHAARHADWPPMPQYEFLADTIWRDFAYGRNAVYTQGHHGNAILSKFPIVHFENHDVSVAHHEARGLLHGVLHVPGRGQNVHAVCVHLGLREAHRRRQLDRLCALLATEIPEHAPLFVAGDFNDWRLHADRRLRAAGLREAFVETTGRPARSFPVRWPLLRLDRIYCRNARVRTAQRLAQRPWSRLSDHAALKAQVCL